MSEKKLLNEEELNKVAGGTGETDAPPQGRAVNDRVEIYYKWSVLNIMRSFGGYIRKIQKGYNGKWYYFIKMDDDEYTGWYLPGSIDAIHESAHDVMVVKTDRIDGNFDEYFE